MDIVIETAALTKTFSPPSRWLRSGPQQATTAVNGVDLQVRAGELFGLLGPNGAGKTTLVKMLCTLIRPSSGQARVGGYRLQDGAAIRAAVGLVVSDERSFYWRLSGRRNLAFFAVMYGVERQRVQQRVDDVLAAVELADDADRRFSHFSSGMRQRLAIARSLLHQPRILFLDEPSRSLDPQARQSLHGLIRRLIEQRGVTVFLITHDLDEAEKLCHRVALMHKGSVRISGPPVELRRRLRPQHQYMIICQKLPPGLARELVRERPQLQLEVDGGRSLLRFQAGEDDGVLNAVVDRLRRHNLTLHHVEGTPPSLEEVFAHYTAAAELQLEQPTGGESA